MTGLWGYVLSCCCFICFGALPLLCVEDGGGSTMEYVITASDGITEPITVAGSTVGKASKNTLEPITITQESTAEPTDSNVVEATDSNVAEATDSNVAEATDSNVAESTDSTITEPITLEKMVPPHSTHSYGNEDEEVHFELLAERPIQLIRPDPLRHRKLEIVERNVKHLHYIDTAVAVVAVVGKFHSGKSFLLNQLMGKQEGFGIGPSVRPQTMGIWMWGKPMMAELPSGEPLSVIFLDTEGFAANNISETYDAKIFSVATLLSSYLLYNSVKIIDQADIDYLELLARRTQLFALRSQITKSKWFEEFNHDLLKFPPLLWVVQDFVQMTVDEESPQEWLHRIMDTSSREAGDYDINLLGIFDSVDCHTLFLPATKKHLLQDLSKATEDDLTPEYKEERDQLIAQLKSGLVPKEKNGKPITGPGLATLLEILVTAANEGSLAEIPGRWEVFIDQLRVSALEDCVTFYESDMNTLHRKYHHGAINETELKLWHEMSLEKAKQLLKQLLFGLESATVEALEGMEKTVEEIFERIRDLNEKKVQLKCSEVQRRIEIEAEEELQKLVLPMKTADLHKHQNVVQEKGIQSYNTGVGHLADNPTFRRYLDQLKVGLGYIFNAVTLRNSQAMEAILQAAIDKAIEKFKEASKNQNRIPRTSDVFKTVMAAASQEAKKVFDEESEMAHGESLYSPFLGLLKTRVAEEVEICRRENLQLVKTACHSQAIELIGNFKLNTGPSKLVLPQNDTELESRLGIEKTSAFRTYSQTQAVFADTAVFTEVKTYMSTQLDEVCMQRREENYQAYIKEVEVPLNTAKKLILLSADKYDTVFSTRQYMKQVCLLNLDEGKAKNWQRSLKEKIAEKFVQNSPELQDVLRSKEGLWSSMKGFWQWLLWLIWG